MVVLEVRKEEKRSSNDIDVYIYNALYLGLAAAKEAAKLNKNAKVIFSIERLSNSII